MRTDSRSPSHRTASIAVNSGVEALMIAPNPTGSVCTAIAMSVNGMAENAAPAMANATGFARTSGSVRRPKIARRMTAPMMMRISAVHTAPTAGEAIRRNRNAPPHTTPRNRSWARWASVTGRAAGAVVAVKVVSPLGRTGGCPAREVDAPGGCGGARERGRARGPRSRPRGRWERSRA